MASFQPHQECYCKFSDVLSWKEEKKIQRHLSLIFFLFCNYFLLLKIKNKTKTTSSFLCLRWINSELITNSQTYNIILAHLITRPRRYQQLRRYQFMFNIISFLSQGHASDDEVLTMVSWCEALSVVHPFLLSTCILKAYQDGQSSRASQREDF